MRPWLRRLAYATLNTKGRRWLMQRYYASQHRRGAGEEEPMRWLPCFVRAGDRVLDVGANVGFYTVRLAKQVGPGGSVIAFEPVPDVFEILRYVKQALRLDNVVLHPCAISDRDGEVEMTVPLERDGVANYYLSHLGKDANSPGRRIRAAVRTLDSVRASGPGRIAFMKCDVEGAELLVMRGAEAMLRSDRPIILCEVSDFSERLGHRAGEVFAFLRALDYRGYAIRDAKLEPADQPVSGVDNYVFLPAGHDAPASPSVCV